jgi:hypothetical protein
VTCGGPASPGGFTPADPICYRELGFSTKKVMGMIFLFRYV